MGQVLRSFYLRGFESRVECVCQVRVRGKGMLSLDDFHGGCRILGSKETRGIVRKDE